MPQHVHGLPAQRQADTGGPPFHPARRAGIPPCKHPRQILRADSDPCILHGQRAWACLLYTSSCLFTAGSVAVLKLLRKNKRFYYRPKNFISVSTLLYRMKQNAAGLASICILSTCVLVTLSSTVCLFLGEEDMLRRQYPGMVNVSCVS